MESESPTVAPGQWIAAVRRADIDLERKGAMLIVASYADYVDDPVTGRAAGEGVHPGTDRFAKDLRRSVATARRYLAWAREVGLIALARRANRRKGLCDEYRLTLSIETLERIGVPDPTAYKELIGQAARARREVAKAARARRADDDPDPHPPTGDYRSSRVSANDCDQRSSTVSANSGQSESGEGCDQRSPRLSADTSISAQTGPGLALTLDERPPCIEHTNHISLTDHEVVDQCTAVTVSRARGRAQDPIFPKVDRQTTSAVGGSGQASPAAVPIFADQPAPPPRRPMPPNNGVCVVCAAAGVFVIAADPVAGSHCASHLRQARTVTA